MDKSLIGKKLDNKYQILSILGEGGLGTVYKAIQEDLERLVAIKLLHASQAVTEDSKLRFEREAKVLCNLNHKNIVKVYSFGFLDEDKPYMSMEYLEGQTLASLIQQERIPQNRLLEIFIQISSATGYAHKQGIVHRDLKPQNIMLTALSPSIDEVKILDFGLSKLLEGSFDPEQKLTQTGALVGSIHYMSPEACAGKKADSRSDIYAIGCMLYECLAGKLPLDSDNPIGLLHKHVNEMPEALPLAIPEKLRLLTFKCLQKNPQERFQYMEELEEALKLVKDGRQDEVNILLPETGRTKKNGLMIFSWLLLIALFASLATLAIFYASNLKSKGSRELSQDSTNREVLTRQTNISRARNLVIEAADLAAKGKTRASQESCKRALLLLAHKYKEQARTIALAQEDLTVLKMLVPVLEKVASKSFEIRLDHIEWNILDNNYKLTGSSLADLHLSLSKIAYAYKRIFQSNLAFLNAISTLLDSDETERVDLLLSERKVLKAKTGEEELANRFFLNYELALALIHKKQFKEAGSAMKVAEDTFLKLDLSNEPMMESDLLSQMTNTEKILKNYRRAEALYQWIDKILPKIQIEHPDRRVNYYYGLAKLYLTERDLKKAELTLKSMEAYLDSLDGRSQDRKYFQTLNVLKEQLASLQAK